MLHDITEPERKRNRQADGRKIQITFRQVREYARVADDATGRQRRQVEKAQADNQTQKQARPKFVRGNSEEPGAQGKAARRELLFKST